jgi:hypothetical protein
MAYFDSHNLTDQELAGSWVAVDQNAQTRGGLGLSNLPSGAVLVDYDTELDALCQRVAASGLKRLTIFKYEGFPEAHRRLRGSA